MPPQVPALAQSENKTKFLERLSIPSQSEEGKRLYQMMKEEAIAGRTRISETTASLLPELANDPNVRPPYSNTQITETAMHAQTLFIYYNARPETRAVYDLGHYSEGDAEENWVIKWMLWHVFRYRDSRNRGRSIAGPSSSIRSLNEDLSSTSVSPADLTFRDIPGSSTSQRACTRDSYWDPVRDAQKANDSRSGSP